MKEKHLGIKLEKLFLLKEINSKKEFTNFLKENMEEISFDIYLKNLEFISRLVLSKEEEKAKIFLERMRWGDKREISHFVCSMKFAYKMEEEKDE